MAKEIERKFLVTDNSYLSMAQSSMRISQGYLSYNPDATVRVRVMDSKAFITVKSRNHGEVRNEWEYEVPVSDAYDIISACNVKCLEKTRYIIPFDGHRWEVDQFHGYLSGLVVAEIELSRVDEPFSRPPFIGEEVTHDSAYYNSSLLKRVSEDTEM